MNISDDVVKKFEPKERLERDPSLTDGKYTLAIEKIQKSEGHKGEFCHITFRVQTSEDIIVDDSLRFEKESVIPKATPEGQVAKVSFKLKDEKQVEKLCELITAIDPKFKDAKNREGILKKLDSADQPYRGVLLKGKITRAMAKTSGKAYRIRRFDSVPMTKDELADMRAELDSLA
jgi:hypothetical protein